MIPGEMWVEEGLHQLNIGREPITLLVINAGDRPIQVGSHYHFFEVNFALHFDREKSRGKRLNIASGLAIRFEPGQSRTVELIDFLGDKKIYGFRAEINGAIEAQGPLKEIQ